MRKISESFKSYKLRMKFLEEEMRKADMDKKAKEARELPEIFVSDRSDAEAEFHRQRGHK